MRTYEALRGEIARGRGGQKKLAGNTYARLEGDAVVVKYHATDIARITPELITLDNGGWFTSTTKERINSYCLPRGWVLYQQDKKWYVDRIDRLETEFSLIELTRETFPYVNGMTINPTTGEVGNIPPPDVVALVDSQTKKLARKIDAYVKGYTGEVLAGFLEEFRTGDYRGDCIYCQFTATDTGDGLGDAVGDTSHLMDHVMEGYRMATLAYRAIKDSGYTYPAVIFSTPDLARKAIRQYLRRRLLKGVAA